MARFHPSRGLTRFQTMPVILLGILLLAVGGAYLLTLGPRRQIDTAARILAEVRSGGLGQYWPAIDQQYFHAVRGGRVVGWRAIERWRLGDGSYQGLDVRVLERRGVWESWRLRGDATAGNYYAGTLGTGLAGLRPMPAQTQITLENGMVSQEELSTPAVAGENYIPEGMLDLCLYLTSRAGQPARFRLAVNTPPEGAVTPYFRVVTALPSAGGRVQLAQLPLSYTFDDRGRILRITESGVTYMPASVEQVLEVFPEAAMMNSFRLRLLEPNQPTPPAELRFGTPQTEQTPVVHDDAI